MDYKINRIIVLLFFASVTINAQFKNTYNPAGRFSYSKLLSNNLPGITNKYSNSAFHSFSNFNKDSYSVATVLSSPDLTLFGNLGNNILNSFKGRNLYFHLAGIASTIAIVTTNTDYKVNKFFRENENYGSVASPITRIGFYLPFVVGGSLYAYGKLKSDDEVLGASFAVLQSSLVALAYNSLLKAITGRPHPDPANIEDMEGLSKTFRFGFLRGGVFWGWPSGHTSSTMAVVSSLANYYPDKSWLKIAGYSLVVYMIYGVTSVHQGRMHWFSDAVAAAFMSYAIGSTVGKYYRNKFNNSGAPLPAASESLSFSFSVQF